MSDTAKKRNRSGESHNGKFSRQIDLSIFGDGKLSAGNRKIACALYGFSQNGRTCDFYEREIVSRYRVSRSTVSRTKRKMKDADVFKRGEKAYEYIYNGKAPTNKEHFMIHEWLYHANFYTESRARSFRLSDCAVEVLSYIRSFDNGVNCSRNWMAKKLRVSPDTVSSHVKLLEKLKLITVTYPEGKERAVNATVRTQFRVNRKALNEKCREVVKTVKSKAKQAQDEAERAERERYYAKKERAEQERQEKLLEMLRTDPEFAEAERELNVLEMEIGITEAQGNYRAVQELLARRIELKRQWRASLKRLGVAEEDLEQRFECAECRDTGVRTDHTFCDCWRRRSP